jgi:CHASE3 domain sensor protein
MNDKWQDILQKTGQISEQKLMDYLEGRLTPEESHEVEKLMADSGFIDDAVEGLSEMKDKQKIAVILQELNGQLKTRIRQKTKRNKLLLPDQLTLAVVTTVTVLFLIIIAYVIYRMYHSS